MHGDATGEAISTALLRRVAGAGIPLRARTTVVDVCWTTVARSAYGCWTAPSCPRDA